MNRQTAADLQEWFDHVPIALYRTTPDGEIVMANQAFAEILGYSCVDELLSCNLDRLAPVTGFAREQFKADMEKYGEIRGRQSECRRADGSMVSIREHVRAVRDQDGQVVYYDGSIEDITVLREAQNSLERSEREYRILFDANPHPMWIFDSVTLRILAVNDAAIAHYGYSRKEFLAQTILDIRPESEVNRVLEDIRQMGECLATTGPWAHQLKDGRMIEVEITTHPTTFSGRPARFVLARDVTEQVHAERILEGREAYYRALIENALDIITIIDGEGMILFESPSLFRLLGYHPEDSIGMSVFDSVHQDDLPAARQLLAVGVESGLPAATIELRMRTAAGEWRTLEACARNLLDNPNICGIVINSRDITERRKAEEELRLSQERLRRAQRAGRVGTWEHVYSTRSATCSPETMALYGLFDARAPLKSGEWLAKVTDDDRERVTQHFFQCLGERRSFDDEFKVKWPDGTVRWLALKSEVLCDPQGLPERLVGVNIDITERKQIEEQLAKARDEAVAASEVKSQFLATVSHEIRTPMNAIMGLAGLLLDSELSPEQRSDLEIVRSSAMHLLDLINEILDLSKAEAGKLSFHRDPFDLRTSLASSH